jgi:hypothetical protein
MTPDYLTGKIDTKAGKIEQVATTWSRKDLWSTVKVRWSVGRMKYRIRPDLYAVGMPGPESDVFVTANFKLSFDLVRRALMGMNAWLLVLDTKGINVWCAAGKGTFGTKELIYRIKAHELEKIVTHRRIILPQLGGPGVAAHEVRKATGFSVLYGPVRADDIPSFVATRYKATPEMRKVRFGFRDRLKLIPVELSFGKYYMAIVPALFFLLSGFSVEGYSINNAIDSGGRSIVNLGSSYLAGLVLAPLLLPWIPFRRFSLKGLVTGWLASLLLFYFGLLGNNWLEIGSWFLMIGGLSSFLAMNFTGTSTFTSLSGVQKEMKTALPVQIAASGLGVVLWLISRFITV